MADVRMAEGRCGPGFLLQPVSRRCRDRARRQHLHSDCPAELKVSSFVDLPHPTGTDRGHNLVRADTSAGEETHVQGRCALYGNEPQRLRPVIRSVRVQLHLRHPPGPPPVLSTINRYGHALMRWRTRAWHHSDLIRSAARYGVRSDLNPRSRRIMIQDSGASASTIGANRRLRSGPATTPSGIRK
jgi:hypothetical protein